MRRFKIAERYNGECELYCSHFTWIRWPWVFINCYVNKIDAEAAAFYRIQEEGASRIRKSYILDQDSLMLKKKLSGE